MLSRMISVLCLNLTLLLSFCVIGAEREALVNNLCHQKGLSELDQPKFVLLGTDLVELTSIQTTNDHFGERYRAEIGGAVVTILVAIVGDGISLTRLSAQPGDVPAVREFDALCFFEQRLSGEGVMAKIVKDGLLVFEKKDQSEKLAKYWIFYSRMD